MLFTERDIILFKRKIRRLSEKFIKIIFIVMNKLQNTENKKIRRKQTEKCVYTICNTTHIASSKIIRVSNNNNNNSNKQINKSNSNKFQ